MVIRDVRGKVVPKGLATAIVPLPLRAQPQTLNPSPFLKPDAGPTLTQAACQQSRENWAFICKPLAPGPKPEPLNRKSRTLKPKSLKP